MDPKRRWLIDDDVRGDLLRTQLTGQRVLVTGAGSFVGGELIKGLVASGASVVAAYRQPSLQVEALRPLNDVQLVQGDLADPPVFAGIGGGVDSVVHVAVTGPDSGVRALAMFNDNVVTTERCLDFAAACGAKTFILLSSVSLHGSVAECALTATTGVNSPSMYGLSKRAAEIVLESRSESMATVALRLPAVLGLGARTHWLSRVVRSAIAGEAIVCRNPSAMFNNAVHRSDLVDFIIHLLEGPKPPFSAFPIASSNPIAVSSVIDSVIAETASRSRIRFVEPSGPSFLIDDSLARIDFGYRSRPIESAVRHYAREEFEHARIR